MDAAKWMTADPVTVRSDAPVMLAWDLMDEHDVRHLPVLEGERLVGVLRALDLRALPGTYANGGPANGARAGDLARGPLRVLRPEEQIVDLFDALSAWRYPPLPVAAGDRLVGVLARADLLRAFLAVWERGDLWEYRDPPVEEHAKASGAALGPGTTLDVATRRMSERGSARVWFERRGRVIGWISERDVRRARWSGAPADRPVAGLLSEGPAAIDADLPMPRAARRFLREHVEVLPVARGGRVVAELSVDGMLDHALDAVSFSLRLG